MVSAANDRFLWLFGLSVEESGEVAIETLLPEWRLLIAELTTDGSALAGNEASRWTQACPHGRPAQRCFVHLSTTGPGEPTLLTVVDAAEEIDRGDVFREIVDKTSAVIYLKDLAGKYQFVNRQFEELFGVTRQSIVGLTDFDIFPEDLARNFRENDEWVATFGQPLKTEEVAHSFGRPAHLYVGEVSAAQD